MIRGEDGFGGLRECYRKGGYVQGRYACVLGLAALYLWGGGG